MGTAASDTEGSAVAHAAIEWLDHASTEGRYVRIRDWVSLHLPTPRDLFVYLPPQYYTAPNQTYPLLLMHDGQNLFDGELSFVHGSTWHVGSTADDEIFAGRVAPLIIVGVGNTGQQRMAEYTPTPDSRLGGGDGPLYARMLVDELLPMLASRYRIRMEPEATGIAGSSLGGLISLAAALRYPHVFGKVGVVSPSLWWDNRTVLKDVRSLPVHLHLKIWLDMGTAEGSGHVHNADLLARLLEDRGWQIGKDLVYRVVPNAAHSEDAWATRLPDMLRFLYPAS